VLVDKYRFAPEEAKAAAAFLLPILDFDPQRRATAQDCLAHPWLAQEMEQGDGAGGVGGRKEGEEETEAAKEAAVTVGAADAAATAAAAAGGGAGGGAEAGKAGGP
jgi:hypothetical protein